MLDRFEELTNLVYRLGETLGHAIDAEPEEPAEPEELGSACSSGCGWCGRCSQGNGRIPRECNQCGRIVYLAKREQYYVSVWCPNCQFSSQE